MFFPQHLSVVAQTHNMNFPTLPLVSVQVLGVERGHTVVQPCSRPTPEVFALCSLNGGNLPR